MSKTGNKKVEGKGRPKVRINDLTENDRQIYQDIMEEVLEDYGIPKNHVMEKVKQRKKEIDNKSKSCENLGFHRNSIEYKPSGPKKTKIKIDVKLQKIILEIKDRFGKVYGWEKIYTIIKDSYVQYKNLKTYEFRMNYNDLNLLSIAYEKKFKKPPKEDKESHCPHNDLINGDFKAPIPNIAWFVDTSFIVKSKGKWKYLICFIDPYNNEIKGWGVSETRNALDVSKIFINAVKNNNGISPAIVHSDRGSEFVNKHFDSLLSKHSTLHSVSPVSSPLKNRPIEFFFAIIKRELVQFLYLNNISLEKLAYEINEYMSWYNNHRIQMCLNGQPPRIKEDINFQVIKYTNQNSQSYLSA